MYSQPSPRWLLGHDARIEDRYPLPGPLIALIYVGLSIAFVIALQVVLVVVAGIMASQGGDLMEVMADPLFLGLGSLFQTGGLVMLAVVVVLLSRRSFVEAFALRGGRLGAFGGAFAVGGAAGFFAGWVSQVAMDLFEGFPFMDPAVFEMITAAILEGSLGGRIVFIAVVVIGAPIFEELIFRGLLWDACEDRTNPWIAWAVTSCLFAGYHMVPIHVISVFSTGALIGLVRLWSGSIWPAVLAHFVNNALSVGIVLLMGEASNEYEVSALMAFASLGLSFAAVGVVYAVGRPALVPSVPPGGAEDVDGNE